ncbi:hypothetical protein [Spongiimicrobium salis]|uniref:hypothetical protein n=1 Tax=Spongiimicrobium salis TaxID=1667022 RepID=UPI00374CA2B0
MKKCAILFSIFIIMLTLAVITDNSDEMTIDEKMMVEKDSTDNMLAIGALDN